MYFFSYIRPRDGEPCGDKASDMLTKSCPQAGFLSLLRSAHPVPSSSVAACSSSSDIVLFVLRTPLRPFSLRPLIRIERYVPFFLSLLQFFFVLIPATLCVPCVTFNNLGTALQPHTYIISLPPVDLLLYIIQDENESRMKKNEI
jgi:hypothetical protein